MSLLLLGLVAAVAAQSANVCPAGCSDCRTDLGKTTCYACWNSTWRATQNDCQGAPLPNCLVANTQGQCTTCVAGFALNVASGDCNTPGTIANCVLEYTGVAGASNQCLVCNGMAPSADLSTCVASDLVGPTTDCIWATVQNTCVRCRYDNLMAAAAGECVGRYVYGCLSENGVGRCNECDHARGYYMKFGNLCWMDN